MTTQPKAADFVHGSEVQLTAMPPPGYEFQNWTGDAAGQSNPALIVMDSHKTVSATFVPVLNPQPAPTPLAPNKIHLSSASINSNETFSFQASLLSGPIKIQSSDDLHSWTSVHPLQTNISAQGVTITVPRAGSRQFYRIVQNSSQQTEAQLVILSFWSKEALHLFEAGIGDWRSWKQSFQANGSGARSSVKRMCAR